MAKSIRPAISSVRLAAILAIAAATLGGCASSAKPIVYSTQPDTDAEAITSTRLDDSLIDVPARPGRPIASSALVFDPPVALNDPRPTLDRDERQPSAFFGYDDGSIEYYRLTVVDRQLSLSGSGNGRGYGYGGGGYWGSGGGSGGSYDRYDREAVSEKVGSIRR